MCLIVVLTVVAPPAVQCSAQQRHRHYIVDLPLPMRPRESTHDIARGHTQLGALGAMLWCFVSSIHQSFRVVLFHHHCLKLPGRPRVSHGKEAFCQACTACGGADVTAFSLRLGNMCDRAHDGANLDFCV